VRKNRILKGPQYVHAWPWKLLKVIGNGANPKLTWYGHTCVQNLKDYSFSRSCTDMQEDPKSKSRGDLPSLVIWYHRHCYRWGIPRLEFTNIGKLQSLIPMLSCYVVCVAICLAVLTGLRFVTDRQTQGCSVYRAGIMASRGKNVIMERYNGERC